MSALRKLTLAISMWALLSGMFLLAAAPVQALGSSQNPQSGSVGLEGRVTAPPPTQAATITTPGNGQTVTHTPITISGLCKTDLLVKVFSNNIFIGADLCRNGSYSISADLFSGQNNLVARVYDSLDQAGPDSNTVIVTFNDAQFIQFGTRVQLSSNYAERGAPPNEELDWPISISGGVGPYALSVDWGDGTTPVLQSVSFAGEQSLKHTYRSAGIYKVTVQATDHNGTTAFLQLVGVATGKVGQSIASGTASTPTTVLQTKISPWIYVPMIALFPVIISTFWLGRRHELFVLRKKLQQAESEVKY